MNLTDEQVLEHIKLNVLPNIAKKFRDGMAKYTSPLIEKDCLAEAMPEAYDLVVYLAAAELQKARIRDLVKLLHQAYRPFSDNSSKTICSCWNELLDMVESRPLAQKKKPTEDKPSGCVSDYEAFCRFKERWDTEHCHPVVEQRHTIKHGAADFASAGQAMSDIDKRYY